MCGSNKNTKSNNVKLFWNGSGQIRGAGNEVWHIGTVQHSVKKERYYSIWINQNTKCNTTGHVGI